MSCLSDVSSALDIFINHLPKTFSINQLSISFQARHHTSHIYQLLFSCFPCYNKCSCFLKRQLVLSLKRGSISYIFRNISYLEILIHNMTFVDQILCFDHVIIDLIDANDWDKIKHAIISIGSTKFKRKSFRRLSKMIKSIDQVQSFSNVKLVLFC